MGRAGESSSRSSASLTAQNRLISSTEAAINANGLSSRIFRAQFAHRLIAERSAGEVITADTLDGDDVAAPQPFTCLFNDLSL